MGISLGGDRYKFDGMVDPAAGNALKNQKEGYQTHGALGGWFRSIIGKSFKEDGVWVNKNSFKKYVQRVTNLPVGVNQNITSAKTARNAYNAIKLAQNPAANTKPAPAVKKPKTAQADNPTPKTDPKPASAKAASAKAAKLDEPAMVQPKGYTPRSAARAIGVINEGDGAVKILDDSTYFLNSLKNLKGNRQRRAHNQRPNVNKEWKLNADLEWKPFNKPDNLDPMDIKSTSFTLLTKNGEGNLFGGMNPGFIDSNFGTGFLMNAKGMRHATHAYSKTDAYSNRRMWLKEPGKENNPAWMKEFKENRVDDYEALQKIVNTPGKTGWNELYSHASIDDLESVVIRSEEQFDKENKVKAILDRVFAEHVIAHHYPDIAIEDIHLPILVVNPSGNNKVFEFTHEKQKEIFEKEWYETQRLNYNEWLTDPDTNGTIRGIPIQWIEASLGIKLPIHPDWVL